MNRSTRGFTLIEILISMSLFTIVGFAVVLLMRTGVDLWLEGTAGSNREDRLEQSLPRLEEDLRMVLVPALRDRIPFDPDNPDPDQEPQPLPPTNRFLSGYQTYTFGDQEVACRYLTFVRSLSGLTEIESYAMRAGTNSKADAYIDGVDDEKEFAENRHLPTGGQVEVLWIWMPNEQRPGMGTVYRAYRSPIGGPGTMLDPKNFDTLQKLKAGYRPQPLFQDVVLFDIYFWTQYTTSWDWSESEPSVTSRPKTPGGEGRPPCGPSRTWDSTRGIMPANSTGFRLGRGERSLNFAADDIWPRMVRIEFAVLEQETRIVRGIAESDYEFTVVNSDFATGTGALSERPMKLGHEWVSISSRDPRRRDTFLIDRRGIRGTKALAHPEDTPVYFGRVFDVTVTIPAFRDDNN